MPPVTGLTAGRIYVCNYITGADGDAQDLDGKTAGVDYCYILIPKNIRADDYTDITKQLVPGGSGIFTRWDSREEVIRKRGEVSSRTELNYIKKYLAGMQDDPDTSEYLFVMYGANDFHAFYDYDATAYEYAKGFLRGYTEEWDDPENELYTVNLEFHIVW